MVRMPLFSVHQPIWAQYHGSLRSLQMPHQKCGLHAHGKTGGFTNSASLNGDKQVSLIYMQTLASCMVGSGEIWFTTV
jgi:hypothetical protein